jgi:hypothetical protein
VSLIGEYEHGGIDNVLAHPLISFLNVLGVASAGTSIVAHTALGDALASAVGVGSREAVGKLGPTGLVRKAVGNIPTGKMGFSRDATGATVLGPLTVSARVKNYFNVKGMGSQVADLNEAVHGASSKASARFKQIAQDFTIANAKLAGKEVQVTDDAMSKMFSADVGTTLTSTRAAYNLVTQSGMSWSEMRAANRVPVEIKELLPHYQKAQEWLEEVGLAQGKLTKIRLPDGTDAVYQTAEARPIIKARDAVDKQDAVVEKVAKNADVKAAEITHNDEIVQPGLDSLAQIHAQIQTVIKRPLSQELQTTLLPTNAADRAWHALGLNRDTVSSLLSVPKATLSQGRLVSDIFKPGGLIDQVAAAYEKEDFVAFRDLTQKLSKKFHNKSFSRVTEGDLTKIAPSVGRSPEGRLLLGSPAFQQIRTISDNLYTYGKERQKAEVALSRALGGKYAKGAGKNTLHNAVVKQQELQAKFEKEVWKKPAPVWQPLMVKLVNKRIADQEAGAIAVDAALAGVRATKSSAAKTLETLRKDPAAVIALTRTFMDASLKSPFGVELDQDLIEEMKNDVRDEIESLRAQGKEPHYVPNFSSRDTLGGYEPGEGTYNVYITPTHYMTPDAAHERLMDQSNTIYDIGAGMTKGMKQQVQSDATQSLIDDYVIPSFGHKQSDLIPLIAREHPTLGIEANVATAQAHLAHLLENTYDLERFDPASFAMASSRHITGDDAIWIPKPLVAALNDIVNRNQFELTGAVRGATNIFRTSVLGYSPRFIAHILFGGSFLQVMREPLSFFQMGHAYKMLKDPDFAAAIHTRSTQIGIDAPVSYGAMEFHREGGKTLGRLWAHEFMDKRGLDPNKLSSWFQVIPHMTFKLTNTITDMQRAMVVLDGIRVAQRRGYYLDEAGNKIEGMTADRALEEGIKSANKVMGDLSRMTPLERQTIATVIPFYGWTKHILQYVATYPVDHPYRAMFLANLANMNSDEVSKGLYTRIQNLFFLGTPSANGDVSAIDVRALNPLRDVANYATLGGLISMLNPVISAPFAMVDPQAIFGSNVLYPNLQYNQLYGTKEAAPGGNLLTAAEQFVPELTGLDAALGLSAQYRRERQTNPAAFAKTIFQALNIPFAQVQHLNLRGIAAQQEIDRYQQAAAASKQALQTGNFGALAGYGTVPNPLQPIYNVAPADLEALYNETLRTTGLSPLEVMPQLPTPAGL